MEWNKNLTMNFVRDNTMLKESTSLKLPHFWNNLKNNCFETIVFIASNNDFHNLPIPMFVQPMLLNSESGQEIGS